MLATPFFEKQAYAWQQHFAICSFKYNNEVKKSTKKMGYIAIYLLSLYF
jgi:hypothetical protein